MCKASAIPTLKSTSALIKMRHVTKARSNGFGRSINFSNGAPLSTDEPKLYIQYKEFH